MLIQTRNFWKLRYRLYALVVMVLLLFVLYSDGFGVPSNIEVIGYETKQNYIIADKLEKKATQKATQKESVLKEIVGRGNEKFFIDINGEIITDELIKSGYNSGFISSQPFVDLNLPIPEMPTDKPPLEPKKPIMLDDIIPRPTNPIRTNFLTYPAYNINVPVIYSSFEDLFNTKPDGTVDFSSPRDTNSTNSPIQKKLEDGIVHMAFTPQPGEIGNSYIVGHSSNYSFVQSPYNFIFQPIERKSKVGEEFFIYDRYGRELKFRVFEVKEIMAEDGAEAYKNYDDIRVVTLQTSILERVNGQLKPTKRWLTRGVLQI